jgi:hypothetical protein
VGVCLIVVFAISVVASNAASASVGIGRCAAVKAGEFTEGTCQTKGEGKFQWQPGCKRCGFKSASGRTILRVPAVKGEIVCKKDTDIGKYTSATTDEETITLTGCQTLGKQCTTVGQKPGVIKTLLLESEFGVITKTPLKVGWEIKGQGGGPIAAFACGNLKVVLAGSLIGPVTPIHQMTSKFTVAYAVDGEGRQVVQNFEGAPKDTLTAKISTAGEETFEASWEQAADVVTNEEKLEINETTPVTTPKWWVEGKLLVGSEAIAEATTVTEPLRLVLHGKRIGEFAIECTELKVQNGNIEAPSARNEEAIVYERCIVVGKPECAIGTTKTKPLKATLEGPAGAEKLRFEPKAGNEIAKWEVTGAACAVKGLYRANGVMICNYKEVETERAEHPLEFTAASGSKVTATGSGAEGSAGFTVTDQVHLASGKLWSAF